MGTVTAKVILDKAEVQLNDIAGIRWTRLELLGWLNDGQRQIAMIFPSAVNKVTTVKLAAGTRQSIPADGWTLLQVNRYMGTDGTTPGTVTRIASFQLMNAYNPSWHAAAKSDVPTTYMYDPQDQTAFFVYPPNTGNGYVEINYTPNPTDLTAETQPIAVHDILQNALLDYIMYRACSKDAEYAPGLQLATGYYGAFTTTLTMRAQSESLVNPNQSLGSRNPVSPGAES